MSDGPDTVTVRVGLSRRDAEAFVAWVESDAARLTTYTPAGIALVNVVAAVREALGDAPRDLPPA